MPVYTHDSRRQAADLAYSAWTQRGALPAAVVALLPALVGPPRTQRAAESFLYRECLVGHEISQEATQRDFLLTQQARELHRSLVATGAFGVGAAYQAPYVVDPSRYAISEKAASAALEEHGYKWHDASARRNANVLAAAEATPALEAKHGKGVEVNHETGKVYKWDQWGNRQHVDTIKLPGKRNLVEIPANLQSSLREDAYLSNPDTDDTTDDGWGTGPDRPFFAR